MNVLYPPTKIQWHNLNREPIVFLAGSIEMGSAVDWQQTVINALSEQDVTILNPRRPDWDSSWKQTPDNDKFREQVLWELDAINGADLVFFNLIPGTMSPISLLELGLMLGKKQQLIVCCGEEFWRYGNVKITCGYEGVLVSEHFDISLGALQNYIKNRTLAKLY